ncbi:hypothetical protein VTI74DRAFT_5687 [Chaetomium olivicolor]
MRLQPALAWLAPPVLAGMEFINPPSSGINGKNPIYEMGSVLEVAWTPGPEGKQTSLVLWQLNATTAEFFGEMEYISRKAVDISRFKWIVATAKNLTVSNLFFLSIFEEGKSSADSNSHMFNITKPSDTKTAAAVAPITTTSSATITITTNPPSSSNAEAAAGTTSTPASSAPASTNTGSEAGGLSIDAKIAIAVTVPCVLILGALAGYLIVKRRRRKRQVDPSTMAAHMMYPGGGNDNSYHNGMAGGPRAEPWAGGHWDGKSMPLVFHQGEGSRKQDQWVELGGGETRGKSGVFELPGNGGLR